MMRVLNYVPADLLLAVPVLIWIGWQYVKPGSKTEAA
jgi:hypothetical protein